MHPIEQASTDRAESQRLAARFAVEWTENRHLMAKLAALESSTAWAVARRLAQWRRSLLPDGSLRHRCFRFCVHALRRGRGDGIAALIQRAAGKLLGRSSLRSAARQGARTAPASIIAAPKRCEFRIAFVGSGDACEAPSLRYRAGNVIEALSLDGIEGAFFPLLEVQSHLAAVLSHHLIVLVRLRYDPRTAALIEAARRLGLPLVYDIDDYLFDPWVLPYVESFREARPVDAVRIMAELGACLHECGYFTGSTSYLADKAASLGKKSFVLPNGLNTAQLQLASQALEQRKARQVGGVTRLGYFSGTRTHQADFRVIYPALTALLRQRSDARLLIVGDLDLGEFPGLLPYSDAIETIPFRPWTELPALLSTVDINLIPLELTPFNEGKSNLKYYEAGLLKVPSIASPTRIHRENITHGRNGLLARTSEEWYDCLAELMGSAERRATMGENAWEYVMRQYTPIATARVAVAIYREILASHRSQGIAA